MLRDAPRPRRGAPSRCSESCSKTVVSERGGRFAPAERLLNARIAAAAHPPFGIRRGHEPAGATGYSLQKIWLKTHQNQSRGGALTDSNRRYWRRADGVLGYGAGIRSERPSPPPACGNPAQFCSRAFHRRGGYARRSFRDHETSVAELWTARGDRQAGYLAQAILAAGGGNTSALSRRKPGPTVPLETESAIIWIARDSNQSNAGYPFQ